MSRNPEVKAVPEELLEGVRAFRRGFRPTEYLSMGYNAPLLDKPGLTAWVANRHGVFGPPERFVERIQEFADNGVTSLGLQLMSSSFEERRKNLHIIAEKVLPKVS